MGRGSNAPLGIGLSVLAVALFVAMDSTAKYFADTYSVVQLVWGRYTFHFVGMLVLAPLLGGRRLFVTRNLRGQLIRAFLLLCATACAYGAVWNLPLANVYAIHFTAPLLVTVLAALWLREPVGIRRWSAIACGFFGALIVVRPGFGDFNWGAVLAGGMAISFALYQVLTRRISGSDGPLTSLLYTAVFGVVASTAALPFVWVPPDAIGWLALAALGLLGALGHLCLITALGFAPASVIAPFSYTQIIWAVLIGYLVFSDIPDGLTLLGAAIVIASGLYVFFRERQLARRAAEAQRSSRAS